MKLHQMKVVVPVLIAGLLSGIAIGHFSARPDKVPEFPALKPTTQSPRVESDRRQAETYRPKNLKTTTGVQQKWLAVIREAQTMDALELVQQIVKTWGRSPDSTLGVYIDSLVVLDPAAGAAIFKSNLGMRFAETLFYDSWLNHDQAGATDYYLVNQGVTQLGMAIIRSAAFESSARQVEVLAAYGSQARVLLNRARIQRLPTADALELIISDKALQRDRLLMASITAEFGRTVDLGYGLERVQQISGSSSRGRFYQSLFRAQVNQPQETFDMISLMFPPDHKDHDLVLQSFLAGGEQASRLVVQYASNNDDYNLLATSLSKLASYDLNMAMVSFEDIPKQINYSVGATRALKNLAGQVTKADPEAAYRWIRQIGEQHPSMREALLRSLSNTDPEFIEQKLAEETDIDLIASLVKRLVRSKRREEPEAALALLEQYSDIDSYAASMRGVASRWGRRNPEEMLAYVIDNPDVKGLVNSVNLVTSSWYQKRPEEVLQWLDSVTRQDVKDKGFTGIAEAMANRDPAAALEVTESISEDRRENVRVQIVTGWVMKNTSRMEEILSQVKLSDEGQACVRRYIPSL